MCCRYHVSGVVTQELLDEGILPDSVWDIRDGNGTERPGYGDQGLWTDSDIRPSDMAPVIIGRQGRLTLAGMRWGLQAYEKGRLLINARAESALDRPMFMEGVRHRRCVAVADHFYEWDREKQKVEFSLKDGGLLCMAAFYNVQQGAPRCILLTTSANESMASVHDRMPLVIPRADMRRWICDDEAAGQMLRQGALMLKSRREYEQLSLF